MERLTPRQSQILSLRCDHGLARKEIAERLGIHMGTVRAHITNATERTGLREFPLCTAWGRWQERMANTMRAEDV